MPSSGSCWYKLTAKWNYGFQHRVDLGRHQGQSSGLSSTKRKTWKESRTGWQVIKHCCCPRVRLCGTAGSQPGGMHTLGSLKTLHKPPLMTAPDTAVRQAYTLTQVSTPLFIRRNAFHNHSCEVHSCLILLALLTYKKTDYGWWNFLMHNKERRNMWLNTRGGLQSNFELCSRRPLVTIACSLFLAGQHEYRIPEEQGKQQNKHTNQIRVSENSSGAKTRNCLSTVPLLFTFLQIYCTKF